MATLLALAASLVALATATMAQTDPPTGGGDWVVSDTSFYDVDYTLSGNLTVNESGKLRLDNMTLSVRSPWDGALTIFVEEGSELTLTSVRVLSTDPDLHYFFIGHGTVTIIDSDLRDLASNEARYNSYDTIAGGVQIYNSSSRLIGSRFHHSQRINVYVSYASPEIRDCQFTDTEYVASYIQYRYSYNFYYGYINGYYTDATGLYLDHSSPNITGCEFRNNGIASSALPFYSTTYSANGVLTFGRGILAYESSPNITGCEFDSNGAQPEYSGGRRYVSGVYQYFYDYLFYDDPVEGGIACWGPTAHPMVNDSYFRTNDVFGICGFNRAYPTWVDRSQITGTRFIIDSSVFSPSAGIYVDEGSGRMTVANTTFSTNLVVANIYTQYGPGVTLFNYSNSDNVVTNGYNVYLGEGKHLIQDSFLDGRPSLLTNLNIGYARNVIKVTILESRLLGASYGIYTTNYNGVDIFMANSTVGATTSATFYLQSTDVDCVNCTLSPLRVEGASYGRGSTVRIMYYLSIEVTWQNLMPIPEAFVQVFNASSEFVYGGISDENGTIGPLIVASKVIMLSYSSQLEYSNSPLYIQAYSSGLQSGKEKFVFITNLDVRVRIRDWEEPNIYLFSPSNGHAQRHTSLEIRGMSTDVGAGLNATYVSKDGQNWQEASGEEQTWTTVLELAEGVHDIKIKAVDKADNEKVEVIYGIIIDLTPPVLEVLDPVKAVWATSAENYTIRGRVSDDVKLASLIINRQVIAVSPDGSWAYLSDIHSGSNEFRITAKDHVGNMAEVVKEIVRDSTVPKLILTSPEDGLWTNISQVEVKGITELGATIRVNGEPTPTFGGRFAVSIFLTEGENRIIVDAVDRAKNIMRVVRLVHLDSIAPVLRIENPQGDMLTNEPMLAIRGHLDDPSVENVVVNGLLVPIQAKAFAKDIRLDEGINVITIEAWDSAQNHATRNFLVTLDTRAPELTVTEPGLSVVTTERTVRIRGRVDPDATFIMWGEPSPPGFDPVNIIRLENTFRYDEYPLVEGINVIHLEAEDDVGNLATVTIVVHYDLVPPKLVIYPMVEDTTSEIIEVRGILVDGEEVRVKGVPVVLGPSGEFSEPVYLVRGKNAIRVVAEDEAGNRYVETINVTRTSVEPPPEGILGAGVGISALLVVIMLVLGMAILYPGARGQALEPEALMGEPIIVRDEEEVELPAAPEEEAPVAEEEPERPRRPLPPPPPDHRDQPDSPPTPPWR